MDPAHGEVFPLSLARGVQNRPKTLPRPSGANILRVPPFWAPLNSGTISSPDPFALVGSRFFVPIFVVAGNFFFLGLGESEFFENFSLGGPAGLAGFSALRRFVKGGNLNCFATKNEPTETFGHRAAAYGGLLAKAVKGGLKIDLSAKIFPGPIRFRFFRPFANKKSCPKGPGKHSASRRGRARPQRASIHTLIRVWFTVSLLTGPKAQAHFIKKLSGGNPSGLGTGNR